MKISVPVKDKELINLIKSLQETYKEMAHLSNIKQLYISSIESTWKAMCYSYMLETNTKFNIPRLIKNDETGFNVIVTEDEIVFETEEVQNGDTE